MTINYPQYPRSAIISHYRIIRIAKKDSPIFRFNIRSSPFARVMQVNFWSQDEDSALNQEMKSLH